MLVGSHQCVAENKVTCLSIWALTRRKSGVRVVGSGSFHDKKRNGPTLDCIGDGKGLEASSRCSGLAWRPMGLIDLMAERTEVVLIPTLLGTSG